MDNSTENRKAVYEYLKKYTNYGNNYDQFTKSLDGNDKLRRVYYDKIMETGGYEGSYDEFLNKLGVKTDTPVSVAQQVIDEYDASMGNARSQEATNTQPSPSPTPAQPNMYDGSQFAQAFQAPDWRSEETKLMDEIATSGKATVATLDGVGRYPTKPLEVRYDESVRESASNATSQKQSAADQLNSLYDDINKQVDAIPRRVPRPYEAMAGLTDQQLEENRLRAAQRIVEDAKEVLEEAGKKGNTNFVAGLGRGIADKIADPENWNFGITDLADNKYLLDALKKSEKGEELTPAEDKLLQAATTSMAVNYYYSQDLGRGYKAGKTTAESIPFMLEFMINPVSASGSGIAKSLLKYGMKKFGAKAVNRGITRAAGRLIGDAAAAAGMTATTGAARTLASSYEKQAENYDYRYDDTGNVVVQKTGDMGQGEALARGFLSNFLENQSEMVFSAFSGAGNVLSGILPSIGKLSQNGFIRFYNSIKNAPIAKQIRERAKIGGLLEEWGEEVYNNFANVATGEMSAEDALSIDNNIDTFLGLVPTQLAFSAIGIGGLARENMAARKRIRAFEAGLSEEEKNVLTQLQDAVRSGDNNVARDYIKATLAGNNLTDQEKKERIFAARDIVTAQQAEQLEQDQTVTEQETDASYAEGASADPSTYHERYKASQQAGAALEKADSNLYETINRYVEDDASAGEVDNLLSGLEGEIEQLARTYLNSLMQLKGAEDSQMQDAVEVVDAFDQSIQPYAYQNENGTRSITTGTYKDRPVYVIPGEGGNVTVVYEDGSREMALSQYVEGQETTDYDEFIDNYNRSYLEEKEAAFRNFLENHPKTQQPAPGVVLHNGDMTYVVTNVSEDGYVDIVPATFDAETGQTVPKNGAAQQTISYSTAMMLQNDYYSALDNQGNTLINTGDSSNLSENKAENETRPSDGESNVSESAVEDTPEQRLANFVATLPKKGKTEEIDYNAMSPQQRYEYTSLIESPEIAAEDLQADIAAKQKQLEAVQKKLDSAVGGKRTEIRDQIRKLRNELKELTDYYQSIVTPVQQDQVVPEVAIQAQEETSQSLDDAVPDVVNDKASDARTRGYRLINGQRVDRQEQIPMQQGRETDVRFSQNDTAKAKFAIVDATYLQPSHIGGVRNSLFFIDEAQPKDRVDNASVMAADRMARDIRPEEITGGVTAYTGSPVINSRGEVIQGNNRSAALRIMYQIPGADAAYREYLNQHAEDFGLTAEQIGSVQSPVLVRVSDVTDNEAIRLGQMTAQDTESGGIERIKPTQTATKLGDSLQSFNRILLNSQEDDVSLSDLVSENGVQALKFLRQQGSISDTQYQSAFDANGNLTSEAKQDLIAILQTSLFEGGPDLLPQMFRALPAKAQKAILSTFVRDEQSPEESRIKKDIQNAIQAFYAAMQFPDFAKATNYESARNAIEQWKRQINMIDGVAPMQVFDNFALELAVRFKGYTMKRITDEFNAYYDLVQGAGADLFSDTASPVEQGEAIRRIFNIQTNEQEGNDAVGSDNTGSEEGRTGSAGNLEGGERDQNEGGPSDTGGRTGTTDESEQVETSLSESPESANERRMNQIIERLDEIEYRLSELEGKTDIFSEAEQITLNNEKNELESEFEGLRKINATSAAIQEARNDVNPAPTEAQKEAGNYKKGHVTIDGLNITIENPKGSTRSGKDASGKEWSVTMQNDYGYIRGTKAVDGDHIDIFLSDTPTSGNVYVVDAIDQNTGEFDESKVMYGFNSLEEARDAYLSNYSEGWKVGPITEVSKEEFKKWIDGSTRKGKPFGEYKSVKSNADRLLTISEIENSSVDPIFKDGAKAYLSGNVNFATTIAYQKVYNDVRNNARSNESDSQGTGGTQLDGSTDVAGSRQIGSGGNEVNQVGTGRSTENVPGEGVRGEDSVYSTSVPDGERGNNEVRGEEPGNDGLSSGRSNTRRSRKSGGDGNNVRAKRGRGSRKSNDGENTKRRNSSQSERDSILDEIDNLLDDFVKAGKSGLSLSVVGMNPEQIEIAGKILVAGVRLGYTYIKDGIYKFSDWSKAMREKLAAPFSKSMKLTDSEIDEFIKDMWEYPHTIDGETKLLKEWASEMGKQELRDNVRMTLEEKRRLQQEAESVPVKVGDMQNIVDTLPYLLPQQQEDVLKAETQFFDESHNDRDHAFGKGYLFTNGTGTGKTYTGLGIVKRFIKQGKNRILILTPSQPKVTDWVNDAKNLGINLTPLESTKDKGEGPVITTFANLRTNNTLMEDAFDLIVYDESHRIMENKQGEETIGAKQHYMLSNKNEREAIERLKINDPFFIDWREKEAKLGQLSEEIEYNNKKYKENNADTDAYAKAETLKVEREKLNAEVVELRRRIPEEEDRLRPEAKNAVKKTKVVFLSATPFNTISSLTYAEGYIFSYPEENKNTVGGYYHRSPREEFLEKNFGAGFRFRYGRIESHVENPEALSRQEVQFSDYLENQLQTKSGRVIDSEYDYSRDFPTVTFNMAPLFNAALEDVFNYQNKEFYPLADAFRAIFYDYNYSTALFETMKIAAITPRIREHLAMGRKVVIFHRRKASKYPITPPFATALSAAEEMARAIIPRTQEEKEEKENLKKAISAFKSRYARLLDYEQTLDYEMPREQIAKSFGVDNVLYFSGSESKKVKDKAIAQFNDDNSGKDIIVIQEASGKEGISLHDTTGNRQRVLITLALPQSPITALQIEGRIYRIGNKSNAIFEYPLLGLNLETTLFGQKFNQQVSTTENLALGSKARNLRTSFAEGVLQNSGNIPLESQGVGGKEFDNAGKEEQDGFDQAVLDYYGNQKLKGKRNERAGIDYFPTPEPIGYKMVEWAQLQEGEDVLEPSAGHGAIARYVPRDNGLTAIEPSRDLFSVLQLRAGGAGRKFVDNIFEQYNPVNKHDVVLMNPPYGTAGTTAIQHVSKAFDHLNEGGRLIAIIPRGAADKKFEKWLEETKAAAFVGEVLLPSVTFKRAGTSVFTRIVVVDKVTRDEAKRKLPQKVTYDLMDIDTIENEGGLFEELRDIEMPRRTIDQSAIDMKNAKKTMREFNEMKNVDSVSVTGDGVKIEGKRYKFTLYANYSYLKNPEKYAEYYSKYEDSLTDQSKSGKEYSDFLDTVLKMFRNVSRMSHEQLMSKRNEANEAQEQTEKTSRYSYKLDTNTATGAEMHLAVPREKGALSDKQYREILSIARNHGGYWNRYKQAFHFNTKEDAESFIQEEADKVLMREGQGPQTDASVSLANDPASRIAGATRRSRKQQEEYAARERRRMENAANRMVEKLGLDNVEIVTDASTLKGDKAKAKGFYSPSTGKITIVLPNHVSSFDVEQTILHEAVAHYGLRRLFGDNFDTFLDNVYNNASAEIRERINKLAKKYNGNYRTATEEYLASLAENTDFENAVNSGWFNKIKAFFLKMLSKAGINIPELTDNELRYILWRSYENLAHPGHYRNVFDTAADVAKQNELKVGNYAESKLAPDVAAENDVLFRTSSVEDLLDERRKIEGGETETDIYDDQELNIVNKEVGSAREQYERTLNTAAFKFTEAWQDSMLGLKEAQDAIAKATNSRILDYENAYIAENAMSSISLAEMDAFRNLVLKPILQEVNNLKKQGAAYGEITDYLMLKHGIERNREMAVREALSGDKETMQENMDRWNEEKKSVVESTGTWEEKQRQLDKIAMTFVAELKDYSGMTDILNEYDNMEERTEEAYRIVNEFEEEYDTEALYDRIHAATDATLKKQVESGLMTKEMYQSISDMYEFYVPLRGWEEKTADEVYDYITTEHSSFNAPVRKAKGRKSKADDPIANIANMAESGIVQGNRNLVKQRFLTMVQNHRTDLASVSNLWVQEVEREDKNGNTVKEWVAVFPEIAKDATPEQVERIMEAFNKRMEEKSKEEGSNVKRASDMVNIPYKILPKDLKEHQVVVKRAGKPYVITINGNPRAAQAINGLTNPNATENPFIKFVESANRFMAANFTQRNPAFVVANMVRDGIYANTSVWVKEGPLYAAKFNRNWAKSVREMSRLVSRYKANRLDMSNQTDRMFYDFIRNGGETGYTFINSVEDYKGIIQKEIKRANRKTLSPMKAVDVLGNAMDTFGRWAEDASRFAAYRTSREMGRSVSRSINDAKEISVNFNRKGAGAKAAGKWEKGNRINALQAWASQMARGLYIFWNAGVQGLTNFGRMARRNPGKFTAMASSYLVLGSLAPLINEVLCSALGGDDDDSNYYNLPEYVRRNNICLYVGGSWLTIPLPIELRALYGLGEMTCSFLTGKEKYKPVKVAGRISQILPIDFLEGSGGLNAFVPSYVKPLVEVYNNESWTGIPIYKNNAFNKDMPNWTKAYKSTSPELIELSERINSFTGGTKYRKGTVDFNPAAVEYLFKSYLGGVATTIDQVKKTAMMPFNEDMQDWRNVVIANRFLKNADERSTQNRINNEYFENKEAFDKVRQEFNGYRKELSRLNPNMEEFAKYRVLMDELVKSDRFRKYQEFHAMDKELNRMFEAFKENGSEELEEQMFILKEAMNEVARSK